MDFFEHQDRARRKTGLLVIYFCAAVVLIIVAVYLAIAGILFYGQSRGAESQLVKSLWFPDVFAVVAVGTLVVVAAGSLYKIAELSGGGERVATLLGGRPVLSNTRELSERILLNVVEEMALASGTPVPPVYLLEEPAINAFAAGTSPQNAVIGVTRGAIETLKRDELQGVIAHEFSHILNGDMRLNIRLMGVLHGILLIAMIGYFLMRTSSRSSYFSSSSSSSKKGGNPLPLLGFCLYVIGYIGVFFGHLIKSAVSRQREFLADASAVQFTRYPQGISGALKKIGGLITGSRLKTPRAEEASHMFFGNALRASFLNMLSTHPPLIERIRRIESSFDGEFPKTQPIQHSTAELINPRTLSDRRASSVGVHAAAVAGAQRFAAEPSAAVTQIGEPRTEHIDYAANLIASLPSELSADVRDPLGAVATIYALLLDDDEPDVRQEQNEYLSTRANRRAYQEMNRVAPVVATVSAEAKLPLVSMALPALHELSPAQLKEFRDDATWLIKADRKVSLFEYAVHRLVLKRLVPRLAGQPPKPIRYLSLTPLIPSALGLLSTLAYASGNETRAISAFRKATERMLGEAAELLPRNQTGLKVVDEALDQLAGATPQIKKRIIDACATCIGADAQVTVEEAELLRVIADALDCPMPPLLVPSV
jgi:Zn-dependent protease with chaperone function